MLEQHTIREINGQNMFRLDIKPKRCIIIIVILLH